jgi:LmbE family N-acetylglucosaminyl deacetylase
MIRTDVSIIGHLISTITLIAMVFFISSRQKQMARTTQQTRITFLSMIVISSVLVLINIFRLVYEISGAIESTLTLNLDWIGELSSILAQSVMIVILYTNKIVIVPKKDPGCILAIGAHPDDIELAAGAALAKLHDAGYLIYGLVMAQGEKGGDPHIRPGEAKNGALFLGLDQLQVHNFTDTHLSDDHLAMTQVIEDVIAEVKPNLIFTHSQHDLHQDHQAVYEATLRAARDVRTTILCYESPSVTQDFQPTYFIDVCGYVDIKLQAIQLHWNQHNKPYMRPDLVRGKLAYRGGQAKVEYAEGFEVSRMLSAI